MLEPNQNILISSVDLARSENSFSRRLNGNRISLMSGEEMHSTSGTCTPGRAGAHSCETVVLSEAERRNSTEMKTKESIYSRLRMEIHQLVNELDFSLLSTGSRKDSAKLSHATSSRFALKPFAEFEKSMNGDTKRVARTRAKSAVKPGLALKATEKRQPKVSVELETKTVSVQVTGRSVKPAVKRRDWIRVEDISRESL